MIALKVEDRRQFTTGLFVGEVFDGFLLKEASIATCNTFAIDGRIRQGYYTEEELERNRIEEYSSWKNMKPFCFSIIKGKRLPESFLIVLAMPPGETELFLQKRQIPIGPDQVGGLYLNIRYEEDHMYCVTGTSLNFFTMDKTLDREWDLWVKEFFLKHQIAYEET